MMKKLCLLLCILLVLTGCGQSASRVLRMDLPGGIESLDPQFTTEQTARMVLANIGEGLLRRGENNALEPGVAESWEISPGGTHYRFFLREDAFWENGDPVTAADFVFALKRLFGAGTVSPHAASFNMIAGAAAILRGEGTLAGLGVEAVADRELEIRLAYPSEQFLELLATAAALPCNEAFFNECRGRYGFEQRFVLANGPFKIDGWDNSLLIRLRPNKNYAAGTKCGGVNLYIGRETGPLENLLDGSADAAFLPLADAALLPDKNFSVTPRVATVWCLVPNRSAAYWGNALLHQGLALAVARSQLELSARLEATGVLVPPPARLAFVPYRAYEPADEVAEPPDLAKAKSLFAMGKRAVGELPPAALYVPAEQDLLLAVGNLQQRWQNELSAYVTVRQEPSESVWRRLATGEFDLLLLPLSPETPLASSMLEQFRSGNRFGYDNPIYDTLLDEARAAHTAKGAADGYAKAESLLLRDAAVIPLFLEKTAFVTAANLSGLAPAAFLEDVYFGNAG